ncbi:hypothetical protein [Clostridium sp. HBUAS56010]|uniref:hypothetical protein n=1 Tax=Clostridium sp. HBUAS56010 TaxID=2571127 RepID=UPI0011787871|nr:hypothetical protein [Clostridium sp. HBUAS56010]
MEKTEQKSLEQIAQEKFQQMAFANLKKNIVQDLINNRNESVIYRKYDKGQVVRMLENPQSSEKELRNMSNFLYIVSSHYRRLINYYASLPKFNYTIIPTNLPSKIEKKKYKDTYGRVCNLYKKYNLKHECFKIMQSVFRDGVFYGLIHETSDSFYIRPFNPDYAKISSIEDGTCTFSINLDYFTQKDTFLSEYGTEIETAYYKYKGNKKAGTKGNSSLRWYEPTNGICIKADENDLSHSVPIFIGLILGVLDIEDYKMLKKAKKEIDNYKVLAMKMDTDENGVPKMDYDLAIKYYNQASANVPEGIGLILSPFTINDFTFQSSSTAESDAANEAEEDFWFGSGTSPLLFGSSKNTSSSSLNLSIKPDESVSFSILEQIQRYFNKKIKKMDLPYSFEMKFLEQSIFNEKDVQDTYLKAGQYGVSGAKLLYANSIGLEPSDISGMSYLEDEILGVGTKIYKRPLISSNTLSNGETGKTAGKPTAEESGQELGEAGEKTREQDSNENR